VSPVFIIVIIVIGVLAVAASFYRLRRGGPGPQTNWIPKSMRGKVNDEYEKKGWQKPYDDHGNRDTDRKPF
jgi:hypothetical protein